MFFGFIDQFCLNICISYFLGCFKWGKKKPTEDEDSVDSSDDLHALIKEKYDNLGPTAWVAKPHGNNV